MTGLGKKVGTPRQLRFVPNDFRGSVNGCEWKSVRVHVLAFLWIWLFSKWLKLRLLRSSARPGSDRIVDQNIARNCHSEHARRSQKKTKQRGKQRESTFKHFMLSSRLSPQAVGADYADLFQLRVQHTQFAEIEDTTLSLCPSMKRTCQVSNLSKVDGKNSSFFSVFVYSYGSGNWKAQMGINTMHLCNQECFSTRD